MGFEEFLEKEKERLLSITFKNIFHEDIYTRMEYYYEEGKRQGYLSAILTIIDKLRELK